MERREYGEKRWVRGAGLARTLTLNCRHLAGRKQRLFALVLSEAQAADNVIGRNQVVDAVRGTETLSPDQAEDEYQRKRSGTAQLHGGHVPRVCNIIT